MSKTKEYFTTQQDRLSAALKSADSMIALSDAHSALLKVASENSEDPTVTEPLFQAMAVITKAMSDLNAPQPEVFESEESFMLSVAEKTQRDLSNLSGPALYNMLKGQ